MAEGMNAGPIVWDLATSTKLWSQGLAAAGQALGQFASVVKSTNFLMIAGWAALGIAAFKAAQKAVGAIVGIDAALREVATLLPETADQMGVLRRELIALSTQVPQPPELLTQATYQAISAGFTDLNDALQIVATGARAAVAGLTDTETAVDVITTALNAYQLEASEAGRVSDIFFKTVEQGKIRFGELAGNFGTTATSAALAGVSLEEVNAAIATLTKFGINAAEATTSLNRAILSIIKPTKAQKEAAAKYGVELSATALEAKGFAGVLAELEEATSGNVEALAEIFPNIRAARSIFVLAGNGADEYRRILLEVANSSGATQQAFDDMNGSLQNQRALLANNINALWAALGQKILPGVLGIVKDLNLAFESQTETLQRLAQAQEDYARAQELADQAAAERIAKELANLENRFKQSVRNIAADQPGPIRQFLGYNALALGISDELDEILTKQFDVDDGWENIKTGLEDIIAVSKDQIDLLDEEGRLNDTLELQIRNRIEHYRELLGIAQSYLQNERELGGRLDAETPEERRLARARERLSRIQRFAPPGSDAVKRAKEDVRLLGAQNELAEALNDKRLVNIQLRAAGVDLSNLDVKSATDLVSLQAERAGIQNAIKGSTNEQILAQARLLGFELEYIDALIRERDARDALTASTTTQADTIQASAELTKALEKLILAGGGAAAIGLADEFEAVRVAVDGIDIEKLTEAEQLKQLVKFVNDLTAALEGLKDIELALPEGVKQLSREDVLSNTKLALFRREFEAIVKSSDKWGIKVLAIEGAMKEIGITVDDLDPAFKAAVQAFVEGGVVIDENKTKMLELVDDISFAINSALALADAFGVSSQEINTLVRNVDLLGRSIERIIVSGGIDFQSAFGAGAALLSIGANVLGFGGESPEEKKRREALKANTAAVLRLKQSVDAQIAAINNVQSADFNRVAGAIEGFFGPGGFNERLEAAAEGGRISIEWGEDDLRRLFGADWDAIKRASDALRIPIPLDDWEGFKRALETINEELRKLDLDILRSTFEGVREWETLVAEVFDRPLGDLQQFEILREALKAGIPSLEALVDLRNAPDDALDFWGQVAKKLTPDFYEKLFGPLSDPATVQAWEDFQRYLIENFDDLFQGGFFGGLNRDEALQLIRDIDQSTDALAAAAEGDSGLQAISAQNKVTTEQADIMIALDQTRNFYLEQIRTNTGGMLEAMTAGFELSPPPQSQVDRFTGAEGTILIERMENNFEISGASDPEAVASATIAEMDRQLGTIYRQRIRMTGGSPRRNR